MDRPRHDPADLERLKGLTVPTLANAIETFGVIPSNEGSCDATLKCIYPKLPMMLGYAVTARISTDQPTSEVRPGISEQDYWRWVASRPGPKVAVVQDIDKPPKGAMWGEWNSNVYKALGCVGTVTEGAVRDFDGVEKLGFHFFATAILPTHGNGVYIDYSGPVRVAGLTVRPGDLLAGDQHGVILIPPEIDLKELARVAAEIDSLEGEIFAFCQSKDFDVDGLARLDTSVMSRWPKPTGVTRGIETR
jgi:4-hydroxy-4-methyl-2-oxoglutarate aldolase